MTQQDDRIADYASADKVVTTFWVAKHLNDPSVVLVESDEDVLLYEVGHIPGAVKIDWHTDLNDPVLRDYLTPEAFAELLNSRGITQETTVVFYGDKANWWATYALWVFALYGYHNTRIMDGGRDMWIAEGRKLTREPVQRERTNNIVVHRDDISLRASRDDVMAHIGNPLVDVRSPEEYVGERTSAPQYPEEGALRAGHIPTAENVPWRLAVSEDGTFRSRAELERLYLDGAGLRGADQAITYCRIGERSSHTWFVLTHLLGVPNVRNYDGSWSEWGSLVGVPIAVGPEPGADSRA